MSAILLVLLCWPSNFSSSLDYLLFCFSTQRCLLFPWPILIFYITFWFAFPFLQIQFALVFFLSSFSFCGVQLSHLYSQHILFVIYFHGCFVDMISCFFTSKSIHAWLYAYALPHPPPSTDFSPFLSLSNSFICNFIMIITPSNIYYHHHLCGSYLCFQRASGAICKGRKRGEEIATPLPHFTKNRCLHQTRAHNRRNSKRPRFADSWNRTRHHPS